MRPTRVLDLVKRSNPVAAHARRPEWFPSPAALLDIIDERSGTVTKQKTSVRPQGSVQPTPREPRRLRPAMAATAVVVIAIVVVAALVNRSDGRDATQPSGPTEVAEAWIEAFLGGDPNQAVALIHPENAVLGNLADPEVESSVRSFVGYLSTIGTEAIAECSELVAGGTVVCDTTLTNAIYNAAGAGPADVEGVTLNIKDGQVFAGPGEPPPALSAVDSHYSQWAKANHPDEFATACPPGPVTNRTPACGEFLMEHLDEWAAAWKAEQG